MKLSITALALSLALTSTASASSHPPISFEEVLRRADVGFHGVVTATREIAPEGVKMAFTVVTFEVREVALDRTEGLPTIGDTVELTFAGGTRGDRTVKVAGIPTFAVGDEVVLFAKHDGQRYADPVIGGPQGRFLVDRDEETGRAFPLTAGRRGLVVGDEITTTERVERIADERPVYREAPEATPAPIPTPVGNAGPVVLSERPTDPRPAQVADVTAFLAAVREIVSR